MSDNGPLPPPPPSSPQEVAELSKTLEGEEISSQERAELELVISGRDSIELPHAFTGEDPVRERAPSRGPPVRMEKPVPISGSASSEEDEKEEEQVAQESTPAVFVNEAEDDGDVRNSIAKMKLPEKIKAAMFGNATARTLLIRDSNRLVQQFVLKNPRIQLREIEDFAKNPNLSEQVLRLISGNPAWTKSYLVKLNLSMNPKTPSDLSVKWVRYLNQTDVRRLSKSRNVPQVVVTSARRRLEELQKK
jgi:hypothetical protein